MQTLSFNDTISAREMQRGYKKVFEKVKRTNKPIVVMANNKPQGAIISPEMLGKYTELVNEKELWKVVERIRERNKNKSFKKEFDFITKQVEAVRQKMYDKSQSNA